MLTRAAVAWVVAVGCAVLLGCGGSKPVTGPDPGPKEGLEDLGAGLKLLSEQGTKPPAKLAEFEVLEPLATFAAPMIRDGNLVYFWGAPYAAGSSQVIAHEKKTPTEGGWVLLQDGTVKQMTAEEFKAAPKAKK